MTSRARIVALASALVLVPALSLAATYTGSASLGAMSDPDAHGTASLTIDAGNKLTAVVEVWNMDPSMSHTTTVKNFTCGGSGSTFLGLNDVAVDATGHGLATTVIQLTSSQVTSLVNTAHDISVYALSGTIGTCGNVIFGPTPVEPSTWGHVKALYR